MMFAKVLYDENKKKDIVPTLDMMTHIKQQIIETFFTNLFCDTYK